MVKPSNPPLSHGYAELLRASPFNSHAAAAAEAAAEERRRGQELPLIDLGGLRGGGERERAECAAAIARASSEWGFFQVVNHGVRGELLERMRGEIVKVFGAPFEKKAVSGVLNNSYRWGNPTATSPTHFNWSEAFHIPLTKISEENCYGDFKSLREVMIEYASAMQELSKLLGGVLVEHLGHRKNLIDNMCDENTCFVRLNHYPPCQISSEVFGLMPHTDSDFLTILHQDEVGGLQLMKDSRWVAVKPIKNALIVNIGDLFQAWSNNIYKSVEHKVMPNGKVGRFSIAYFLCPSYDSVIGSCQEPSIYRSFTFREYRNQIQEDVKLIGHKIGLSKFLY
nr:gibberellin 2-beta-dioxygenase 8-like [Ipomoea batatas]